MKSTKELEKELNEELNEQTTNAQKRLNESKYEKLISNYLSYGIRAYLPLRGYKLHRMENNKPLTLLNEKEKHAGDFVAFININQYFYKEEPKTRKIYFDIDENKKTTAARFELHDCYAIKDARKDDGEIFLISNKNIKDFSLNYGKRIARHKARTFTGWERFKLSPDNEKYFSMYLLNELYNKDYRNRYYYEAADFDKNGYFIKPTRDELKKRADAIKKEKAEQRKKQITKEWRNMNHYEHAQQVNPYTHELKKMIVARLDFESVLNCDKFAELKKLRELYNSFMKQYNYNNYENVDEWNKCLDEKIKEYNFYMRAIKKGVLDRVACLHHYQKTQSGEYINIATDAFFKDEKRYIQRF